MQRLFLFVYVVLSVGAGLSLFAGVLCSAELPQADSAQTRIKPTITRVPSITVTTTRAEKFSSPVPFSEISRAELEKLHTFQDLPVLLAELPSTVFYSENGNNVGYTYISMRGFDQRRISVMINGIPQNDPEDHNMYWINLPDLTASLGSVQVQRGAGHANYGHAAIGGSINLNTSNFAEKSSINVLTGLGFQEFGADNSLRLNVQKYSLEASSGLIKAQDDVQYAVYARLTSLNSEGYRNHSWAQLTSFFVGAARFDKNLTTQINIFGGPIADGLAYTGLPKAYIQDLRLRRTNYSYWEYDNASAPNRTVGFSVLRRPQEIENFSQPHYELLNEWFVAPNVTVKSALFYYTGDGFFDFDGSWADAATLRMTPEYGFRVGANPQNTIIRAFVGNRHGGWLPRVVWKHGGFAAGQGGELTVGAEVRLHRSDRWGKIRYADNLPEGFDPEFKIYSLNGERDIFSVYARENYSLNDALSLNLEAQLVRHSYRIRNERAGGRFTTYTDVNGSTVGNGEQLFDVKFVFLNPRVGVNYLLAEQWNAFASVAYTSREPRMDNLYRASESYTGTRPLFRTDTVRGQVRYDFTQPLVRPERMLDVELGTRFQAQVLSGGVNLYWMEFTDELVRNGQRDIFGTPIDGNAPRTRHYGVELEGAVTLWQTGSGVSGSTSSDDGTRLWLSANATFSRNVIVELVRQNSDGSSTSLAGNALAGFPDVLAGGRLNVDAGSTATGKIAVSLMGRHVGAFYTDFTQNALRRNDAFTVFGLDVSYTLANVLGLNLVRVRGQVNNLFNALYSASGVGDEFFPAAERNMFVSLEVGM